MASPGILSRLISPDGLFDIVIVGLVLLAVVMMLWAAFVAGWMPLSAVVV